MSGQKHRTSTYDPLSSGPEHLTRQLGGPALIQVCVDALSGVRPKKNTRRHHQRVAEGAWCILCFPSARRCHSMKINRTPSPPPSQPAPCNQARIINKKYLPLSRNALWDRRYPPRSFGLTCPHSPNAASSCAGTVVVLDTSVSRGALLSKHVSGGKCHNVHLARSSTGHTCEPDQTGFHDPESGDGI